LRQQTKSTAKTARPLVGIVADGASGYGRAVMRGVMRYANAQRRWIIHDELRRTFDADRVWPKCDGAIVGGVGPTFLKEIIRRSRHVVHCSGSGDPAKTAVVCLDDEKAGELAAEHLLDCQLGHFGFYGPAGSAVSVNRAKGFSSALQRRDHKCTICPVERPDEESKDHWPKLIDWVRSLPKPVGIMAFDDTTAHDLAGACLAADIAVPEQVAIIGVNNDDLLCESAWPPLSSVNADYSNVGYAAAQVLDQMLRGERLTAEQRFIRLPPLGVVKRQSTDVLAVDDPQVADAIRFIREHACDPCSVDDLLREVPVGRRWLERQFVKRLGRTPRDEILRVQMDAAKRLLLQPALTLPEIAERCGFSSGPTFGRAFLRAMGTTPATYRRAALRSSA
jgi:LacI family transcriptional regulator